MLDLIFITLLNSILYQFTQLKRIQYSQYVFKKCGVNYIETD